MANFSIEIDLAEIQAVAPAMQPQMNLLQQAINQAALYVRDTWGQAVQGLVLPGMTKAVHDDDYYEALHTGAALQMIGPLHGAVICTYAGVDRVENGFPSFDMKPGLLAGRSAKRGKRGRYNVVPFRHMTPKDKNGVGSSTDRRAHGAAMPADVYKIVKKTGTFQDPGSAKLGQQIGQRSKIASQINIEAIARNEPAPMPGNYTWRVGMYHNMRRVVKQYGTRTQSTYWTFRTVSDLSDPASWIHPGQPANPLIAAVVSATRPQVEQIVLAGARAAFGLS